MGQLAPAEAKNCSLPILAYLLSFFGNITNTERVDFEEGTPNQKLIGPYWMILLSAKSVLF